MQNAAEWLVIINSVVLALFLVLSIVLIIKLLSVIGDIKKLTKKADNVASSLESAAGNFNKFSPIGSLFGAFYKARKNTKGEKNER